MDRIGTDLSIEQIDDWFKIGKKVEMKTLPRFALEGGRPVDPNTLKPYSNAETQFNPPYKRHGRLNNPCQTAYADHYKQLEEDNLLLPQNEIFGEDIDEATSQITGALDQIDVCSTYTGGARVAGLLPGGMSEEEALGVYQSYPFQHQYDPKLAITKHRRQVVDMIESNQVTVIEGETGSGKTTQVAQFILDHYREENKYCNIVVTQPRRIAAISIARRVCHERGWQLGNLCGYHVGLDNKTSQDTRITYCTTGVLLRKLIKEKNMLQYTHVILDEVHERDKESDFCLLISKKLQRTNSKDVKIVLMSATFDTHLFANYFALQVRGMLEPAPVFKVTGRSYSVREFYLEDLRGLGELPNLDPNSPEISMQSYQLAAQLVRQFDIIEGASTKSSNPDLPSKKGSVLIFLPGIQEIHDMDRHLTSLDISHKLIILPVHSSIPGEEQAKVFDRIPLGHRKVILSTNIAESSITVPDIEYVIDFCLTKSQVCDPETNYTKLEIQWAPRANCKQRKGRAGRVSNGRVYRLVTRRFYEECTEEYAVPEMQRSPLSQVILQVKLFDLGETKAILGLALSPPNLDDIEKTILMLKEVGAMASLSTGEVNPHDGDLTFLGRALANLPVDIHLGRLMMFGHVFGLLRETIIISAALSLKSFFAQPFKYYLEAYKHKLAWANDSFSDCISYLNAFNTWCRHCDMGNFPSFRDETAWGRTNYIQIRRMHEVRELCIDLNHRLKDVNICTPPNPPEVKIDDPDTQLLLKLVLCGAFYPNYSLLSECDEEQALRTLSGRNPFHSVYLKGFPSNQGILYKKNVENMFIKFELKERPKVRFEETRAYVEFPRDVTSKHENSNTIVPAVYMSIKLRLLRLPLEIMPFSDNLVQEKIERMRKHEESNQRLSAHRQSARSITESPERTGPHQVALPTPQLNYVELNITEIVECGHFWAHYGDEKTWNELNRLQNDINKHRGQHLNDVDPGALKKGSLVLALFDEDVIENYYRARIIEDVKSPNVVKVFFVDYGNVADVLVPKLRRMEASHLSMPFQAMEMELCGIKPSVMKCPSGRWSKEATEQFKRICDECRGFIAKVYSVVHGVVRVTLDGRDMEKPINDMLVDRLYADKAEESLASKQNHKLREEEGVTYPSGRSNLSTPQTELRLLSDAVTTSRHRGDRSRSGKIVLSGPWSPLEMSFYSMTAMGNQKQMRIQRDSVNSVALNNEPQCNYDRMMVAASVGLNPSGSSIIAYDTTLLPSIPGLPALMALTFTPTAELRTDIERTRYTGALCGLGWDPISGGPALPDHDMEIAFDTVIDKEDIKMINQVRMAINLAIGAESSSANWGRDAVIRIQHRARNVILNLVKRRRDTCTPVQCLRRYRWNLVSPDHLLRPMYPDEADLLNLHCQILLKDDEEDEEAEEEAGEEMLQAQAVAELMNHAEMLKIKASKSREPENIACKLCSTVLTTPSNLRLHLASMGHKEKLRQLQQLLQQQ